MAKYLNQGPDLIPTAVLSIDDFYLSYQQQKQLAAEKPSNPLIQHRGQPSTHDLSLCASVLSSLRSKRETHIPAYDKSAFHGKGDRISEEEWVIVNKYEDEPIEVVIFEGWCVGFRALEATKLHRKWEQAVAEKEKVGYRGRLGLHQLENLEFVNEALKRYDVLTEYDPSWIFILRYVDAIESAVSWTLSSTCKSFDPLGQCFLTLLMMKKRCRRFTLRVHVALRTRGWATKGQGKRHD